MRTLLCLGFVLLLMVEQAGAVSGLLTRPDNGTCVAPSRPAVTQTNRMGSERLFLSVHITQGMFMVQPPDDPTKWLIAEQGGVVSVFDHDPVAATKHVLLDISDKIAKGQEGGLQSVVYHPNYPEDRRVFLFYTTYSSSNNQAKPFSLIISSVVSTDGGQTLDPATEEILLDIPSATTTHNGGTLAFGPDGYLYISVGDEARSNFNALDNTNLRGTVLRIDVDGGTPYAIPADNPLVGTEFRPEIYAWGFRNPFRMTFDDTGRLWLADVGGDDWEEIDIVEKGSNYGWPKMEGAHCRLAPCDNPDFVDPVFEYPHDVGGFDGSSAVGTGAVYKGSLFPDLVDKFIFADIVTGRTWAISFDENGNAVTEQVSQSIGTNNRHLTIGPDGELYAIQGFRLMRMVPRDPVFGSSFPSKVSEIGCFDPANPTMPGAALIPYEINVPFWSDGARKSRWMVIPDGEQISIDSDGRFIFPVGSMLFKNFRLGSANRLTETRMLVRHADGGWAGYTYEWNYGQTDASLVAVDGKETVKAGQAYSYPSRNGCIQCHNEAATFALGPEIQELNRSIEYPSTGLLANQLETYDAIGLLAAPLGADPEDLPALPETNDATVSLEQRARAYLHSNCATCHRPGGPGRGELDFRFKTPLQDTGMINKPPMLEDLGIVNARIVAPGDPDRSILAVRMGSRSTAIMMPPLGSHLVDTNGVSLIHQWISSITTENSNPVIDLTSPLDGSVHTTADTLSIEASATDSDGNVIKVEFFIDGTKVAERNATPFSYAWTNPSPGQHVITAVATDDLGATAASSQVNVTVETVSVNTPPTVSIQAPGDGATVNLGSDVLIKAVASDADGQIDKVEFFANGTKLGEDISFPYNFNWVLPGVGTYQVTAVATDDQQATTLSGSISITVIDNSQQLAVTLRDGLNGYFGTQDAFLFRAHPDINYGARDELKDRLSTSPADVRTLVKFHIFQSEGGSVPDGATITSARLRLYKHSPYSASYRLSMLLNEWIEDEVTWNESRNGNAWQTPGASQLSGDIIDTNSGSSIGFDPGWLTFDVTSSVQAMSLSGDNHGWRLTPETGGNAKRFHSREYAADPTLRPTLEITYTTSAENLSIAIDSPTDDSESPLGQVIPIAVTPSGNAGGIEKIEFFANGIKIGEDNSLPYAFSWLPDQIGVFSIEARATEMGSETVSSLPIDVTIVPPETGGTFQILLQDGANGYTGTRDAYLNQFFPESNFGGKETLSDRTRDRVGLRSLIRFAVFQSNGGPLPDNATITSATLALYKWSSYSERYRLDPVLLDWTENGVSWDNTGTGSTWATGGAGGFGVDIAVSGEEVTASREPGWLEFNVTSDVQSFASDPDVQSFAPIPENHGWRLTSLGGGSNKKQFYSREYIENPSKRPMLRIEYTLP